MERGIDKIVRVFHKHKGRVRRETWDDGVYLAVALHGRRSAVDELQESVELLAQSEWDAQRF